jgi:hypothetical protein
LLAVMPRPGLGAVEHQFLYRHAPQTIGHCSVPDISCPRLCKRAGRGEFRFLTTL